MTDKRKSTVDIDITKCEFCNTNEYICSNDESTEIKMIHCNLSELFDYKLRCEDNPNCYYKQLAQKEQALEKIVYNLEGLLEAYPDCNEDTTCNPNESCDKVCQNYIAYETLNIAKQALTKEVNNGQ